MNPRFLLRRGVYWRGLGLGWAETEFISEYRGLRRLLYLCVGLKFKGEA